MMNRFFIAHKITELRLKKDVSKCEMSLDLGRNKNYISNVTSGKTMPSVLDLISICEYFGSTMSEFFDENPNHTGLIQTVADELEDMDDDDILLMLRLIRRTKR